MIALTHSFAAACGYIPLGRQHRCRRRSRAQGQRALAEATVRAHNANAHTRRPMASGTDIERRPASERVAMPPMIPPTATAPISTGVPLAPMRTISVATLAALPCSKPPIEAATAMTMTTARAFGDLRSTPIPPASSLRIREPSLPATRVSIPRMAKSGPAPSATSIATIITTAPGPESHKPAAATPAPSNTPVVSRRPKSEFAATSWAGELANHGSSASWRELGAARVNPSSAIGKKRSALAA